MQYKVQAVDNILQFDIHDDIRIVQGEENADIFTIVLPLRDGNLNLAEMSYTLKGTVGSYEMREILPKSITEESVLLTWSPKGAWTALYGTLRLTLIATATVDEETVVSKWVAPEGLTIQKDPKGKNNVTVEDVAYQLLTQMQEIAASLEMSNIKLPHNTNTIMRDAPDAHPIESITGLRAELDSKTSVVLRDAPVGNLLSLSANREIVDSGYCCTDFVTKDTLDESLKGMDLDKTYIHRQESPSDIWHVRHTLNKMPVVTVVDSSGNVVIGEVSYKDTSYLTIKFNGVFSGKCYLN